MSKSVFFDHPTSETQSKAKKDDAWRDSMESPTKANQLLKKFLVRYDRTTPYEMGTGNLYSSNSYKNCWEKKHIGNSGNQSGVNISNLFTENSDSVERDEKYGGK